MDIIYLLIGITIGLILGYLLARVALKSGSTEKLFQGKNEELEAQLFRIQDQYDLEKINSAELSTQVAKLQEELKFQKATISSNSEFEEKLNKQFSLIAQNILDKNSSNLSRQNLEKLELLLNPLNEKIKHFNQRIDKNAEERSLLKGEIKALMNLNKTMSQETQNLTRALKGDNKQQGNWGEIILEKVLENSGLREGKEYEAQYSTTNQEGSRLQPDVVINLPNNKHIIIDSKVSLTHYEQLISEENEHETEVLANLLCNSIESHVKGLHEKNYQNAKGFNSPDFVLLFMPIESAFGLAIQHKPKLFSYAWDKKIVIVSPSTLLATLRTVASIWKHENQSRDAEKIAQESGKLFDKFVDFIKDMEMIGKRLEQTNKTYDDAFKKLTYGRGNLVKKAEDLRQLGINNQKKLPSQILDDSGVEDHDNKHE